MAIPKYTELYRPVLNALADGTERTSKEIRKIIAEDLHLSTTDTSEMLESGRTTVFMSRVGWACTYLFRAGLIERPARACFRITEEGVNVLENGPEAIDNVYLLQYDSFRDFVNADGVAASNTPALQNSTPQSADKTPDDIMEEAYVEINKKLQNDLMEEILKLSSTAFERLVLDLMFAMGYGQFKNASRTTPASGDEGIDGVIMQDKLGFDLIYVQAKKWDPHLAPVGRPVIQAFFGAIAGQTGVGQNAKGLFVTTSKFSAPARDYAEKQHIILIDGEKLTELMIENNFGVSVERRFEIKSVNTDLFNSYEEND